MNTEQLLGKLEAAWQDFQDAYKGLTPEQLLVPGVTGRWSVRDIIAHVTVWDEEALKNLPLIADGRREPRYSVTHGGIDAFNAIKTEERRHLSLADVLREHHDVHTRLVEFVAAEPAELYASETRFRRRLRLDTYSHYPVHARAIRSWREGSGLLTPRHPE